MKKQTILLAMTATLLTAAVPLSHAQTSSKGDKSPPAASARAYGPGMMWGEGVGPAGGYGPGMMWGGGPGAYGPGMMGGYGRGRYGYGPGMMGAYGGGGWGMGGMMGFAGPGMMGGSLYALDLSDQQRTQINQIQDEVRKKNWDVMGKLIDEQAHLRDLYAAEKRDPAAIGKQTVRMAELQRQLVEASVEAHNRIEALLSKEQKGRLRSFGPGWMMGDD